jgi:hypothetical protein
MNRTSCALATIGLSISSHTVQQIAALHSDLLTPQNSHATTMFSRPWTLTAHLRLLIPRDNIEHGPVECKQSNARGPLPPDQCRHPPHAETAAHVLWVGDNIEGEAIHPGDLVAQLYTCMGKRDAFGCEGGRRSAGGHVVFLGGRFGPWCSQQTHASKARVGVYCFVNMLLDWCSCTNAGMPRPIMFTIIHAGMANCAVDAQVQRLAKASQSQRKEPIDGMDAKEVQTLRVVANVPICHRTELDNCRAR